MTRSHVAIVILIVALLPLVYYVAFVPQNLTFAITPEALQIRGDVLYSRSISRSDLQPLEARVVNGSGGETVDIGLRTNGVGLPNYQSGWFRTTVGKALIFSRPGRPMVAIPTIDGYTLLLTPRYPQEFLNALRTPGSNLQSKLTD